MYPAQAFSCLILTITNELDSVVLSMYTCMTEPQRGSLNHPNMLYKGMSKSK